MNDQQRVVERAIALIGRTELAEELGVWWSDVESWRDGREPMPQPHLERTAVLIIEKYQALA